ncbi:MAG TPA: ankyrin repeat domain-containing protein [Vicinamibacterales bacterium]|jgi:hypothetical protein|nr:ankyrin repeat domain-containing protein [Vicinamibacterales bacterium]
MQDVERWRAIDRAFRDGDLAALRAAVEDPSAIPNGPMPLGIGNCLTYAIYWSPLAFIRQLLELGANPSGPADDGFPPLIAALSCTRSAAGANHRSDVDDIIRLLLAFGADPNQRGINDWTALHMAVAERNAKAVQRLLDAGADADLRTRIDDCETPAQMAQHAGLTDIAAIVEMRGQPLRRRLRPGIVLLVDVPGNGEPVRRQHRYRIRLRMLAEPGGPVRWKLAWGPVGVATLEDDGTTLLTEVRIDRRSLTNGLFYGIEGMRVGGLRRLEIAPHMAYGARGVPGTIEPHATLVAEIEILAAADA